MSAIRYVWHRVGVKNYLCVASFAGVTARGSVLFLDSAEIGRSKKRWSAQGERVSRHTSYRCAAGALRKELRARIVAALDSVAVPNDISQIGATLTPSQLVSALWRLCWRVSGHNLQGAELLAFGSMAVEVDRP